MCVCVCVFILNNELVLCRLRIYINMIMKNKYKIETKLKEFLIII